MSRHSKATAEKRQIRQRLPRRVRQRLLRGTRRSQVANRSGEKCVKTRDRPLFGLNPFDYLKDLFTRLPAAKITQIKEFTPAAWTKAKEQVFAQAA